MDEDERAESGVGSCDFGGRVGEELGWEVIFLDGGELERGLAWRAEGGELRKGDDERGEETCGS